MRNAIRYVLMNATRHGVRVPSNRPDPFSSGTTFDGWRDFATSSIATVTARARSWLLGAGWRQRGLIPLTG